MTEISIHKQSSTLKTCEVLKDYWEELYQLTLFSTLCFLAFLFKLSGIYTMENQYFVVPNIAFTLGAQYSCNSSGRLF